MLGKMSEESSLEQSYRTLQRIEPNSARTVLGEAKKILDQLGVIFFLRQRYLSGRYQRERFYSVLSNIHPHPELCSTHEIGAEMSYECVQIEVK